MTRASTAAALVLLASTAFAQEGQVSASPAAWKGLEVGFLTKIEPPGTRLPGGVAVESGRVHRMITDRAHKIEFGYDLEVEPAEDGQTAQFRVEPFVPANSKISFDPGTTFLGLPKYPTVSGVHLGDTVALDLLANAATGQRIVDYLVLRRHGEMDRSRPARDFQLSDAELTVLDTEVTVDGRLEPSTGMGGGFTGAVVWLYVPGHGRFVLSLVPKESLGFVKNGIVSGNGLLFHDGPVEIRVECSRRVAPGSGVYNLYVVHQPAWRPTAPGFTMGSADQPESVLGRK